MRTTAASTFLGLFWGAPASKVDFIGNRDSPSAYAVTDFAAASIAAAAMATRELAGELGGDENAHIVVDRSAAALWFASSVQPEGWDMPAPWDALAGDYPTSDGWIRLHTNAPHHRRAALTALGLGADADRSDVAARVASRAADELETSVVAAGGCAAAMRSEAAWMSHPQGAAVAAEPLAHRSAGSAASPHRSVATSARPLDGVRVLDLTRVLAGPMATRYLTGLGADVLRIDPPDWNEPALEPEVTLGKRCGRLDLQLDSGRQTLLSLLGAADIVVHGYRPGALDGLGLGAAERQACSPGLVDICLDAYGWSGPWASRRGFDSLVQMSCGIAATGMEVRGADRPVPLPMQALDHATGYLLAAEAIRGWTNRLRTGFGCTVRASLARTAHALVDGPRRSFDTVAPAFGDVESSPESTPWGPVQRLRFPATIAGTTVEWTRGTSALGSESAPLGWRAARFSGAGRG